MLTAEEHRRIAWDCLKLSEATSNPQTHAALLHLAQYWVRMAGEAERDQDRLSGYRAKAWQCASRAQSVNDPEKRAASVCRDVDEPHGIDTGRPSRCV